MPSPGEGTGKLFVVGTGPGPLDQMTGRAQAAIRALNGKEYKGRKIVVSEARSRSRP